MTGIKLLHRSPQGIFTSFMGASLWRNRQVTYFPGLESRPNPGCGPLAVYEDTPEGLEEAMIWARMETPEFSAVFRCTYEPSAGDELYFTFNGGEVDNSFPWNSSTWEYLQDKKWVTGEVVRYKVYTPHTILADMVRLDEELVIA